MVCKPGNFQGGDGYGHHHRRAKGDRAAGAWAFGLRSACFTLEYKNDRFTFHVRGYGHCVGMSQYGADYMARQGSSWEEIVQHYYKGAEIKEL